MKRAAAAALGMSLFGLSGALGHAEEGEYGFPCGRIEYKNESHQWGQYNWVEYIVETTGVLDVCGQWFVTTSAHVVGVKESGMSRTGLMYSQVRRAVPVPEYSRRYQVNGRHVATSSLIFIHPDIETVSHADVGPEPGREEPTTDGGGCGDCPEEGNRDYDWSPIILDVGRNGYRLTSIDKGVHFDLNADGVPEQVAWTHRHSDEAFLAMDRNGNGRIDNGAELFGNVTPAYPGSNVTTPNGFEALKFLELPDYGRSVIDGVIDANDAPFRQLLLWRDANHNGISEPDELQPAAAAGVYAIHTEYKNRKRVDKHGNEFRQRGLVVWLGSANYCFDVWLQGRY